MHKERRNLERSDYISQQRREDSVYGRNNTSGVKGSDDGGRASSKRKNLEKYHEQNADSNFQPSGSSDFSEMDIAYKILSEYGTPVHYKMLINEILMIKGNFAPDAAAVSELYTLLNMDRRFKTTGGGMWTLA